MADQEPKPESFRKALKWTVLTVVAVLVSELTLGISGRVQDYFSDKQKVSIDFQEALGCPAGQLADIANDFDRTIKLSNGADNLIICYNSKLSATPSSLPRELANMFPGCLSYSNGTLDLMRVSEAVCKLPEGEGYLCIGSKSLSRGNAIMGKSDNEPAPCDIDILRKFGF